MNDTWIKLYRKMNDNDIIRDANALQLFTWLLINVDHKTGEIIISRGWVSKYLKQNPNTFYAVVTRLRQRFNMISTTTTNNNQATKIRVLNWAKYQSKENPSTTPDTGVTNDRQLSDNSITRIKNKEYKNTTNVVATNVAVDRQDTNSLIPLFEPLNPAYKKLFANKTQREALDRMIDKYTWDKMKNLLVELPNIVNQKYAPTITTPLQLEDKMGALVQFLNKQKLQQGESKHAFYEEKL